jgi:membrane associated rhomboid family serine protease
MKHTVREELHGILVFLGAIWAVFLLDLLVPLDFNHLGLVPRTLRGLLGILTMPFLHANLNHLISNTIPLFVLRSLLAGSKARSWKTVAEIILLSGVLLWIFGRPAVHVGASGLIFGLAAFLVVSGFLEKRLLSLAIAILIVFLYGGSLLSGILPRVGSTVSWDGHLMGAVAGGIVAYGLTKEPGRRER